MFQRGALPADVNICGYARSSMHTSALLAQLGPHLRRSKGTDALFERFASRLSYVTGQYAALLRAAEPLTDIASQFAAAPLHDGFGDGSVASRLHAATLPGLVGCAVAMRSQAATFGLNSLNRIHLPARSPVRNASAADTTRPLRCVSSIGSWARSRPAWRIACTPCTIHHRLRVRRRSHRQLRKSAAWWCRCHSDMH